MPSTQRYLSVTESLFASSASLPGVASFTVDGIIEPTILNRALTTLAAQYPVLRGQIVRDNTGFLLRIEDQIPTLTVHHGAEDTTLAEINTPLQLDRQVARTVLSRDGANSTITLAMDHSVADGRLTVTLLYKLLDNYTMLAAGNTPPPTPPDDLPPPLDTRLAGQFSDEEIATFITQTLTKKSPVATLPTLAAARENTAPSGFAVRTIAFTAQATTEILTTAKKNALFAHGLISGAILAALRAQLEPATEPLTLAIASPVDLRDRLTPPLAPDAQLCCIGRVWVFVTTPHPADPLALGRQIITQLHTAIGNGDPQKWILAKNHLDAVLMPPTSVGISDLGRLPTPPTPRGIRVTASRALGTYPGPIPLIFVSITGGRLTLDLVYDRSLLTDQQMTDLANGIELTLGSCHSEHRSLASGFRATSRPEVIT
jgi:phenolphthiocerol/phthiocerol/phthiodiolone dimycocerosyl transferase